MTFVVSVSVLTRKMQQQTTPYLFRRLETRPNGKAKVVLVWPTKPSFPFGGDKSQEKLGLTGQTRSVMIAGCDPELAISTCTLPDTTWWGL